MVEWAVSVLIEQVLTKFFFLTISWYYYNLQLTVLFFIVIRILKIMSFWRLAPKFISNCRHFVLDLSTTMCCPRVSLYDILHELAEGSSKCFKFHYLVSQSTLLDTYFLFLPKIFLCRFVAFWFFFCTKPWIYTRKSKLAHILCICGSIFTFLDIF
jgi:hypothetical protein